MLSACGRAGAHMPICKSGVITGLETLCVSVGLEFSS